MPGMGDRALSTEKEKVQAGDTYRYARDLEEEARLYWAAMARGAKPSGKKKGK